MTGFIKDVSIGISSFSEGWRFIIKNKLRYFFFFPLTLLLFQLIISIFFISLAVDALTGPVNMILDFPDPGDNAGIWEKIKFYAAETGKGLAYVLIYLGLLFVALKINKYVMLILLSPVLSFLSEKTEAIITGNDYPFSLLQFVKDLWRGFLISFRNFLLEISLGLILWIMSWFIPFLAPLTIVGWFLIGAYFYGFAMVDYYCERKGMTIKESIGFINSRKGLILSNGSIFAIGILIPVVGAIIFPVVCCVSAVIALHKQATPDWRNTY